ncbi:MAG: ParA family protein [Saccharofermentanales bacterium]|jgi:chromosome partitioning protein
MTNKMNNIEIIAIVNNKGGVGKTTTAVNLGYSLSKIGKKVLIIDLDQQSNTTQYLDQYNLSRYQIGDLMFNNINMSEIIRETDYTGLYLIPCSEKFNIANAIMRAESLMPPQLFLKRALDMNYIRENNYDYILIDCPPQLQEITANALTVATNVIVPIKAGEFALEGYISVLEALDKIRASGVSNDAKLLGALLTISDSRLQIHKYIYNQLLELGEPVFETVIRQSTFVEKSVTAKKPIAELYPDNIVAIDYIRLAEEISEFLGV